MAANFKISPRRSHGELQLELIGDFDGTSACQLLNTLGETCGFSKVLIDTKRLRKRIDELLADAKLKVDQETLAREVAIFAERSDISEEVARLESHLQQFEQSCQANDQAGRRLDFISQEMLREANTIASKASDTKIIGYVVDIKCRIDRIKEQVQNIE